MDVNRKIPQNITVSRHVEYAPAWSPDGKRIVFVARSKREAHPDIYVMDANGKNPRNLTKSPARRDSLPAWSPNGKYIAFSSWVTDWHNELPDIYVMNADGRNSRNLTANRHPDNSPSWSSDSKRIAFASKRDGDWEIYVMDADGQNPRNLTKDPIADDSQPAWFGPSFAAVAPAGKRFAIWGWLKQGVQ